MKLFTQTAIYNKNKQMLAVIMLYYKLSLMCYY